MKTFFFKLNSNRRVPKRFLEKCFHCHYHSHNNGFVDIFSCDLHISIFHKKILRFIPKMPTWLENRRFRTHMQLKSFNQVDGKPVENAKCFWIMPKNKHVIIMEEHVAWRISSRVQIYQANRSFWSIKISITLRLGLTWSTKQDMIQSMLRYDNQIKSILSAADMNRSISRKCVSVRCIGGKTMVKIHWKQLRQKAAQKCENCTAFNYTQNYILINIWAHFMP